MHDITEIKRRLTNNYSGLGTQGVNLLLVELVAFQAECLDELKEIRRQMCELNEKTPKKRGPKPKKKRDFHASF